MEPFVVVLNPEEVELQKLVEPLLDAEGYELVRILVNRAQTQTNISLFVDMKQKQEGKTGVQIRNLEDISRLISDVLDVELQDNNFIRGAYNLEVSSPGVDRPLTKLSHFRSSVGEKIRIILSSPHAEFDTKKITGLLEHVRDKGIELMVEDTGLKKVGIEFGSVMRAHKIFDFSRALASKGHKRKN